MCTLLFGIFVLVVCQLSRTAVPGRALTVQAAELTNETIRQKQAEISAAQQERDSIKSSLANVQRIKQELEASRNNLNDYVTKLDAELARIQANIEDLKQKIEIKEAEIAQTQLELEAAIARQEAQYNAMKKRVRFIFEKGDSYYLQILLESASFSDMLNKQYYIEKLSEYDRKMLDEYTRQKELVELTKQALEEEQATLEETKAGVEEEEANIEALIKEKQAQIAAMQAEIANKQGEIDQYEARVAQQNAEIAELERIVAAEKQRLAEANRRHYGGGVFAWPAPSYTYISSEFGYRTAPTTGASTFHSGLDMAAPSGSAILAAADGDVVAASYSSSMGNYVMIDHGDGLYTIYMHASSLLVSKGQVVSKGQQIARVGSTGISTGPHLHFSVRLNGSYVNPWNYLGR